MHSIIHNRSFIFLLFTYKSKIAFLGSKESSLKTQPINTTFIQIKIGFKLNADKDGWTPFYSACGNGYIEIIKLLLNDQRVDINKASNDGWTPFYSACSNGHIEIIKLLLNDNRVDINKTENDNFTITKKCWTPFHRACEKGNLEVVKLFLNEKRISIRKKTNEGKTALEIAKEENHSTIVKSIKEFDTGNITI